MFDSHGPPRLRSNSNVAEFVARLLWLLTPRTERDLPIASSLHRSIARIALSLGVCLPISLLIAKVEMPHKQFAGTLTTLTPHISIHLSIPS